MSSVVSDLTETTLANVEAQGDQGLLNLQSSDTVFYVGGYPKTFIVSSERAEVLVTSCTHYTAPLAK